MAEGSDPQWDVQGLAESSRLDQTELCQTEQGWVDALTDALAERWR